MFNLHNLKEAFLATTLIIICAYFLNLLFLKFDLFKGIKQNTNGFDLYEFFFAEKNKNNLARDTNIVLVQIEDDREKIAGQINIIQTYKPAVIGIDAIFKNKKDSSGDAKLIQAIKDAGNIVFATRLVENNTEFIPEYNFFRRFEKSNHSGYDNLEKGKYNVVRKYAPFWKVNNEDHFAFTSRIAELYSPKKFTQLKNRQNPKEIINYSGNTERFTSITKNELIEYHNKNQLPALFKNKIVLLGYFMKYPPLIHEDLYFSPLNGKLGNESTPDMYGITIHANILSMVLNGRYSKITATSTSFLIAFLLTFFIVLYLLYLQSENELPAYTKIILIQFLLILFVLYILLQVYNHSSWKVPLLPILISSCLCVAALKIYGPLALWLHKKINYKTVFI